MISPEIAVEEAICDKQREAEVQPATDLMPLGELCTIQIGRTPARADSRQWDPQRRTKNVWVSIADMSASETLEISSSKEHLSDLGAASGRIVPAGTILLSFKLSIGKVAVTGCDLYTNEAIAALLLPDDAPVCREFLVWFLRSVDWEKEAAGSDKVKGATLNKKKLSGLLVPVPPVSEQKRIAAKLDAIDDRIRGITTGLAGLGRRQSELLGLVFAAEFAALDCPVASIRDVCEVIPGQSPLGTSYNSVNRGTPFYQGKKAFTDRLLGEPAVWTTAPARLARSGDVLMSVRAPVGPVNQLNREVCIGRGLAAIRPGPLLESDYLFWALRSMEHHIRGTDGAVFPSINKAQIEALTIPLPTVEEQAAIVRKLDKAIKVTERLQSSVASQIDCLARLRAAAFRAHFPVGS